MLYKANCKEQLKKLAEEKTGFYDALITDPPYGLTNQPLTNVTVGNHWKDMNKWDTHDLDWLDDAIPLIKENGNIVIFTDWHKINLLEEKLESLDCTVKDLIRWEKNKVNNPYICKVRFVSDCEYALWAVKGRKPGHTFNLLGNRHVKPFVKATLYKEEYVNGRHPTQKPIAVGKFIIEHLTNPNDNILDPFCGSASFGVAAIQCGRGYTGIEIDDSFYTLSEANLADAIKKKMNDELDKNKVEEKVVLEKVKNEA